ncbi:hypothetical protein [Rhizobium halophytocola]|uniref:Uncharacterized protein n=1 Tax=Rhizobium halophytocola TaxID=735519 RepID=A0ABS4DUQ8_9HYPH|nr:hypothetical protein [Rhizobium halophytocola]MBP1849426.1 hypothetical protein [Rhizobium halophytocola]
MAKKTSRSSDLAASVVVQNGAVKATDANQNSAATQNGDAIVPPAKVDVKAFMRELLVTDKVAMDYLGK